MIRDRERARPEIDHTLGVVDAAHALHHERTVPVRAQPRDVIPIRQRALHPLVVGAEERRRLLTGLGHVRGQQSGHVTGLGVGPEPARPRCDLRSEFDDRLQSDLVGDPRAAPVASVGEGPVQGEDDPLGARFSGSLEAREHRVAVPRPVHLEEHLGVHGADLFEGAAREGAEPHRDAATRRATRNRHLSVGVHRLNAGRRDQHRHRHRLAHHGRRHRAFALVPSHVRRESQQVEGLQVVARGKSLFGSGDEGRVDGSRESFLGPTLGDGHRLKPLARHRFPVPDSERLYPRARNRPPSARGDGDRDPS